MWRYRVRTLPYARDKHFDILFIYFIYIYLNRIYYLTVFLQCAEYTTTTSSSAPSHQSLDTYIAPVSSMTSLYGAWISSVPVIVLLDGLQRLFMDVFLLCCLGTFSHALQVCTNRTIPHGTYISRYNHISELSLPQSCELTIGDIFIAC